MNAIEIKNLRKKYPSGPEALKGINLTIKKGEFFGLLGPNGAGKSTTISIICSLTNKTDGQVLICNEDIDKNWEKAKQYIGVVPQEFNFNIFETCLHIVVNQAGYYGVPARVARPRAVELFKALGLSDKINTQAGRLSGGLKRRLMIARALIHNPEILILDEPTAGVDISLRRSMWAFLEKMNRDGLTIILTTHYLEEAEALCKRIAIIDQGTIIENDSTDNLLRKVHSETFVLYCDLIETPELSLNGFDLKKNDETTLEANLVKGQSITELVKQLADKGITVQRIRNKANRLEEMFVKLVNAI